MAKNIVENFETKLSRATFLETRDILGAIGLVVDRHGTTLYHKASGYQSLASDALPIDHDSTFTLASAGKFIIHIAALQCVERGLITLDEPVHSHLPELENVEVISRNKGEDISTRPFLLRPSATKITLRHLLSHSSGIDFESNPIIKEWRNFTGQGPKDDFHPIIDKESNNFSLTEAFSMPLLFDAGEGWMYGASIEWTAVLVARLTKQRLAPYTQDNIFKPLGMISTTYQPQEFPEILSRLLKMVRRDADRLLPVEYTVRDLVSSVSDMGTLLADLISTESKLLKEENRDLLFQPQFGPSSVARSYICRDTENYAAPAGIPSHMTEAPVNHSLAALVVEEELPLSHMPPGTVTWNGMPNLIWAMHKEKGLGMLFVTQLLPVDDEKTVDLAMTFMREMWDRFG